MLKQVKNIVALALLGTFCYSIAGYYIAFKILRHETREEIIITCQRGERESVIIHIPDTERETLTWHEKDGFEYQGQMYDVAKAVRVGDGTDYYCINDSKEEAIIADVNTHFDHHIQDTGVQPKESKISLKNTIDDYFLTEAEALSQLSNKVSWPMTNNFYCSVALKVVSRPPKV